MVQEDNLKTDLIVVCGPTASGKSALAVQLAKKLDSAVVSADSIAIYKDLYIGTAKPSKEEMDGVSHYLIDFVDSDKDFTVAEYSEAARKVVDGLIAAGKTPILCGGTGYYIESVLYDLSYGNCPKNDEIRSKLEDIYQKEGVKKLHEMLREVDEESYLKLHENDVVRVIRALEIFYATGNKKSLIVDKKTPRYNYKAFTIEHDRASLYERINLRVDKMFDDGLKNEVVKLLEGGLSKDCQSMQAIGYKEVVEGLERGYDDESIKELIKRNTRRYAKRQITYFKRLENLTVLKPDYDVELIVKELNNG